MHKHAVPFGQIIFIPSSKYKYKIVTSIYLIISNCNNTDKFLQEYFDVILF